MESRKNGIDDLTCEAEIKGQNIPTFDGNHWASLVAQTVKNLPAM